MSRKGSGPTRRDLLSIGGATIAGALIGKRAGAAATRPTPTSPPPPSTPGSIVVPNGRTLEWRLVDGVKVFHLVAEEVEHEFAPGLRAHCWGYNGGVHGPVLEATEGERVRIYVTNRLPTATSVHWHAILLPNGMDGVGGLNQRSIRQGETYKYEFTLRQSGTAMYHSHHDEMVQIGMGMTGLFVIHPRRPVGPRIDRDFALLLHEWRIDPGARRPNPFEMTDFNVLTINAKSFPATDPLVVQTGQRVRIRIGNLSPMSHHPIHLHGFHFTVTDTDGGPIPESARQPAASVLVPVGTVRTIELVADAPGDWALHCHMTHHMMNQMGHESANMIGVRTNGLEQRARRFIPGYMTMGRTGMAEMGAMGMKVPPNTIPMLGGNGKHDEITAGGMFTVVKVRDRLTSYDDPGWYENPPGTLAVAATSEELRRDGIVVPSARDVDHGHHP